ncbi:MAG: VOC family protein [Ignavibacteria bacterium]
MENSKVRPVPDGYHTVTPYLIVKGIPKLIDFLKQTFDAKEIHRFKTPDGTIAHAEVKIGDSVVMMGEAGGTFEPMPCMIHMYVDDADKVYNRALKAGATSLREPKDQFYGDRSGGVKDASGNQWWISTHIEDVSPEEIRKREEAYMNQKKG